MRWDLLPSDTGAEGLGRALGLHPLVAQLLWRRGLTAPEQANAFLRPVLADLPDPLLLEGCAAAVERLGKALRAGERITAYGDYDVDGVTSTTLLTWFLRRCGGSVEPYVPHRLAEGYGLNLEAVGRLAASGTQLLVTLDCGVTAVAEVERATALGVDVIVVDHHTAPAQLPRAVALLNPWQPGCRYPTKHLCAVGVTFLLCVALRRKLREDGFFSAARPEPDLRTVLDLVALGTIADVVPLTGANRILVRAGLLELAREQRPGIRALKRVARLPAGPVTAGQVGFRLGPRINAAGRLADAGRAVELLLTGDEARAGELAEELDRANAERQLIEQRILEEATAMAAGRPEVRGLVLHSEGWHPGVVGIVASRIAERFHRPAVVIGVDPATGIGKGSGRSIEAFHLHDALAACAVHLQRFGGHKHAAGVTVTREELPAFRAAFEREAALRLAGEELVGRCRIDAQVTPSALTFELCQALDALAPFGAGNPEPVLALTGTRARSRVVGGAPGKPGHLKLKLPDAPEADAIGFGLGGLAETLSPLVDLAFTMGVDEYRGERRLQLKLRDVRDAEEG